MEEEASSSSGSGSSSSAHQKRKRNQVVPHSIIGRDEIDDSPALNIIDKSTSDDKNKQPLGYFSIWQKEIDVEAADLLFMDGFANHDIGPSTNHGLETDTPAETSKDSDPDYMEDGSDADEDDCYEDDDDDYDYDYDTETIETDCNYNLASKFDDMDLPPGVEATVPWLQKLASESSSGRTQTEALEDKIDDKFKAFKQFDIVQDHSDHHFSKPEMVRAHPPVKLTSDWAKRIQHEWKLLKKDLPDSIKVRAYEDRQDLLRAVILGPAGTPYHDGLFFFDVYFPANYPSMPPLVHYHSGGLRLNPNLYACGKVCLSLLGTWQGSGCEKWSSSKSTMLQVLVSIQALVLNEKPYFNEPGFTQTANTAPGERRSLAYNEEAYVLSLKTMLYTLRKPPKHFEDFIAGHFRNQGRAILLACKAYMTGIQVGSAIKEEEDDTFESSSSTSKSLTATFPSSLKKLFEDLLMEFTVKGADCKKFLDQKIKAGKAALKL